MSLFRSILINEETSIGIWKNDETEEALIHQLKLSNEEKNYILSIKNDSRRRQWLCSRVCLRYLINTDQFIEVTTDKNGKPFVRNFPVHISISHTEEFAAVIMSEKNEVGIDIDRMELRIEKIAHKFLREEEKASVTEKNTLHALYLFWCAKEAMYKFHGRKKLDFREHLFVTDFSENESGIVPGEINRDEFHAAVDIHFDTFCNHRLAWVSGDAGR